MIAVATRLLVILLVLSSTGVLPAVSRLAEAECDEATQAEDANCADEKEHCADCAPDCGVCICCPLRATPTMRVVGMAPIETRSQRIALAEPIRVLVGMTAEIFHPPRV